MCLVWQANFPFNRSSTSILNENERARGWARSRSIYGQGAVSKYQLGSLDTPINNASQSYQRTVNCPPYSKFEGHVPLGLTCPFRPGSSCIWACFSVQGNHALQPEAINLTPSRPLGVQPQISASTAASSSRLSQLFSDQPFDSGAWPVPHRQILAHCYLLRDISSNEKAAAWRWSKSRIRPRFRPILTMEACKALPDIYSPLDESAQEIRLIEIQAAGQDKDIECKLLTARLGRIYQNPTSTCRIVLSLGRSKGYGTNFLSTVCRFRRRRIRYRSSVITIIYPRNTRACQCG